MGSLVLLLMCWPGLGGWFWCGVISAFVCVVVDLCILCILVLGLVLGCSGLFAFWFAV